MRPGSRPAARACSRSMVDRMALRRRRGSRRPAPGRAPRRRPRSAPAPVKPIGARGEVVAERVDVPEQLAVVNSRFAVESPSRPRAQSDVQPSSSWRGRVVQTAVRRPSPCSARPRRASGVWREPKRILAGEPDRVVEVRERVHVRALRARARRPSQPAGHGVSATRLAGARVHVEVADLLDEPHAVGAPLTARCARRRSRRRTRSRAGGDEHAPAEPVGRRRRGSGTSEAPPPPANGVRCSAPRGAVPRPAPASPPGVGARVRRRRRRRSGAGAAAGGSGSGAAAHVDQPPVGRPPRRAARRRRAGSRPRAAPTRGARAPSAPRPAR